VSVLVKEGPYLLTGGAEDQSRRTTTSMIYIGAEKIWIEGEVAARN